MVLKTIRDLTKRWSSNEDGSITLEFVLTFPLLSLWFVGSFVWFDAFRSNSNTAKVAYTLSDISSRWARKEESEFVTISEINALFDAHKRLLPPRIDDGWMRVTSVCFNGDDYKVLWSFVLDDTYADAIADPLDDNEPRLIPLIDDDVRIDTSGRLNPIMPRMADDNSIILTEVFATWRPLADWVGFSETNWINRVVNRPRYPLIVPLDPAAPDMLAYPDAKANACPNEPSP